MPISNTIDQDTGIIFENWTGDIRAPDLRAYWEHILADPDVMARRRTLVDLRQARIHFNGQELANLVAAVVIPALKGLHWITAIVGRRSSPVWRVAPIPNFRRLLQP
jgi:hypothetical protein